MSDARDTEVTRRSLLEALATIERVPEAERTPRERRAAELIETLICNTKTSDDDMNGAA